MNNKIAFIFPGQGSQYVGMGKELYEKYDTVKKTFDEASDALGFDIAEMCFHSEDINKTEFTQPVLVTMGVALMRLLEENHIQPDMTAGLSLGEYASLVCSGVLDFPTAVALVRKRGKFMQECIPDGEWGMAAIIGLEDDIVEKVCSEIDGFVKCANYNCPGQIVIAGEKSAVENACTKLTEAGARRAIMLNVTAPFHTTKLMMAKENLAKELEKVTFNRFHIPVVKNLDATEYYESDNMVEILSNHIVSPVQWKKSVEYMIANGIDTFIELGPGKTLSGFVRKINKDVTVLNVENIETFNKVLESLNA